MPGPEVIRRNFKQYDRDNGQSGIYGAPLGMPPNTLTAVTANRINAIRFEVTRPMRIISGGHAVTTAASIDDACDMGIYDVTGTILLAHIGATNGLLNGLGSRFANLITPVVLVPRTVYYSAFVGAVAGTAATTTGLSLGGSTRAGDMFSTVAGGGFVLGTSEAGTVAGASATLPSTISPTNASVNFNMVAWREF